mmetsp:Transcript_3025/g.8227  ORF Transcript_3025/g.8227 Transcript_3025/m.8227 type:complete len:585 (-) Transcript_3025:469-2223(-)
MAVSRRIGRRRRQAPSETRNVSFLARAAAIISIAVVSSLIGHTVASRNGSENSSRPRKRSSQKISRGLRAHVSVVDETHTFDSRSDGGRKRDRIRKLSSTSTVVDAGLPPLTSHAIENLAASWDTIPIIDGTLQLPEQQQLTPIAPNEINSMDSSKLFRDDDLIAPRIVGGTEEPNLDSFVMHMRYIEDDEMWKFAGCGGTLISRCHILTAGHCMTGDRADRTQAVYVNAWRPFSSNSDTTTGKTKPYHVSLIDSDKTAIHPKFNNTGNLNDVAVLTMTKCIPDDTAELFEIIEIANDNFWRERYKDLFGSDAISNDELDDLPTLKTRVAGFGKIDPDDTSVPSALQSVEVSIFGRDDCQTKYDTNLLFKSSNLIQADMYCAGAREGGKDACLGDSGGPNYYTDPLTSKRTQLGVVSWGIGCAQVGFPGVYTSVAYHYDFIKSAVCEDERLGDFGVTTSTVYSQFDITAASPLRLCLPDDIPASNNAGGAADPVKTIIIGESINGEAVDLEDVPQGPSCFKDDTICERDSDCCDTLICKRRDKVCGKLPRRNKGRLTDGGTHGGAGASTTRNTSDDRRRRLLRS